MKAKRYKLKICNSTLEFIHGFGHIIDEISVEDIFINEGGIHKNYQDRTKEAFDIEDIEFDEMLYNSFKRFVEMRESLNKEIKIILGGRGDVNPSNDAPLFFTWEDFEKNYLPKSREERLKKEETADQAGDRLAKEALKKIEEDLHKHKRARRKK